MASQFRILVIEDEPEKGRIIREELFARIPDLHPRIDLVVNLVEAMKRLETNYYDLVILDIRIPAAGKNPRSEHSRAILEQLESGRMVMPACVVGLTAFEKDYRAELKYYEENLFSIEHFKADSDVWICNIVSKIRFVSRWKAAYGRAHSSSFDYDVVFLTARAENEYKPILEQIEWATGPSDDFQLFRNIKLKTGTIRFGEKALRTAICCVEEMGLAPAAALASQLISQFRPKAFAMLGMCCGFRQEKCHDRSSLGDVIVVREAACWDEGRYGELEKDSFFFNRAKPVAVDARLDRLISSLLESEKEVLKSALRPLWVERKSAALRKRFKDDAAQFPDIKYGLMLSGSSVVAHDVKGDEIITRFPNALGLEMEIFGVYKAADRAVGAKPAILAVKGVADFGDGSKHKEFQSLASRLSYCVAREILARHFDELDQTKEARC